MFVTQHWLYWKGVKFPVHIVCMNNNFWAQLIKCTFWMHRFLVLCTIVIIIIICVCILETVSCMYVGILCLWSLSIPNFTEGLLGIVIKSVGKENFHSSHIVLHATKMLSCSLFFSASCTLNNFKTKTEMAYVQHGDLTVLWFCF